MAKPLHTLTETLPDGTSFEMVQVEGGNFQMGSEEGLERERPVHEVQVRSFYLGRYLITQSLWKVIMGVYPKNLASPHPKRPIESISWYDAIEFCNKLSGRLGYRPAYDIDKDHSDPNNQSDSDKLKWTISLIDGTNGFRLPTEAEWEFAARGGKYSDAFLFTGASNFKEVAWGSITSQNISQPIGLKLPNALGFYDMNGNIREWIWDWHSGTYYRHYLKDEGEVYPLGPNKGVYRNVRGGSWYDVPQHLRPTFRFDCFPSDYGNLIGLRVSRSIL